MPVQWLLAAMMVWQSPHEAKHVVLCPRLGQLLGIVHEVVAGRRGLGVPGIARIRGNER
jgi:hypothetical protein